MKTLMALTILLLSGCTHSSFKFDDARKVQLGMDERQLINIMGDPKSISSSDDSEVWVWVNYNGFTGKMQKVSYVIKDGKVIDVPAIPKSFD
jgi:hypothetical protein